MTWRRRMGSWQLNREHPMSRKPSRENPKASSLQEAKSKVSKNIVSREISAAENLANELTNVPITEVAKIAALLPRQEFSPQKAVAQAYRLLESCAVARRGIKEGLGYEFSEKHDDNEWRKYGPSNLRWQKLKAAFPRITTHRDEPPYVVSFEDGLAKLMGKNTTIPERPEILRRFMEQECQNLMGCRYLSPEEVRGWIEFFRRAGIVSDIYIQFWCLFPRWRETDISAQKAKNAQKVGRKARPPKIDAIDRSNLDALKYAAYVRENS